MCGDKRSRQPLLNSATGHSQRSTDADPPPSLALPRTHSPSASSRHSCSTPSSDAFHYVPLCPIYSSRRATFVARNEIRARDTVTKETSAHISNAASLRVSFIISLFLPVLFFFCPRVARLSRYRLICLFHALTSHVKYYGDSIRRRTFVLQVTLCTISTRVRIKFISSKLRRATWTFGR